MNKQAKYGPFIGAGIGALAGGGTGALASKKEDRIKNALIGAGLGALTGGSAGYLASEMKGIKKATDEILKETPKSEVKKVEQGVVKSTPKYKEGGQVHAEGKKAVQKEPKYEEKAQPLKYNPFEKLKDLKKK